MLDGGIHYGLNVPTQNFVLFFVLLLLYAPKVFPARRRGDLAPLLLGNLYPLVNNHPEIGEGFLGGLAVGKATVQFERGCNVRLIFLAPKNLDRVLVRFHCKSKCRMSSATCLT